MRILILIFLLFSSCICYSDAASYINEKEIISFDDSIFGDSTLRQKRSIVGGETEQDPNDPKYQKMARDFVHTLHVLDEDIKKILVYKVTTQVVSGIITRMSLRVFWLNGESFGCNLKVWEQPWKSVKHISHECDNLSKKKLSVSISPSRPAQSRNPNDPKYKKLAQSSVDYLVKTAGSKLFKKEDIKTIQVNVAKVQIGSKITNAIQFRVTTVHNDNYQCTSTILEKPWIPEEKVKVSSVNCTKGNRLLAGALPSMARPGDDGEVKSPSSSFGHETLKNPDDPEYEQLAKESFEKYIRTHKDVKVKVKEFKVTRVTEQVVNGVITRINFYVIPNDYQSFPCHSRIYNTYSNNYIEVSCVIPPRIEPKPGGEVPQNPDDYEYAKLAKESFDKYQKTHKGIKVKEIKVTKVTKQLVTGQIYRIVFYVIDIHYESLECQSKIQPSLYNFYDISVNCGAQKKLALVGGKQNLNLGVKSPSSLGRETLKNPDDPEYEQLAKESFEKYIRTHKDVKAKVKEFKVTRVTEQVVNGVITRINFYVIPNDYQSFPCHSRIYNTYSNNYIEVSCVIPPRIEPKPGGEVPQNPDDYEYAKLAKESFDKYQKTHKGIKVKEIKVTKVTKQLVTGQIYRIVFYVIDIHYESLECQSKIQPSLYNFYDISVNCAAQKKLALVGGKQNLNLGVKSPSSLGRETLKNPDDPEYEQLAKESFEKYIRTHKDVKAKVKEFKVTRVTEQVVNGVITRINFYVIPNDYQSFPCHSRIYNTYSNNYIEVSCVIPPRIEPKPGGEVPQNPDDYEYAKLAKESFDKYQKTHKGIKVKEIKVTKVTKQLVTGQIYRLVFYVIDIHYESLECQSKIQPSLYNFYDISVNCGAQKKLALVGGKQNLNLGVKSPSSFGHETLKNPDDPEYEQLAEKSFQQYIRSHKDVKVNVKEFKVTKVTQQVIVVNGVITRMVYYVIPTDYQSFPCHAENYDTYFNKHIRVSCVIPPKIQPKPGDEFPQDPDDYRYAKLAKESFDKYQETYVGFRVREIKVTKVTRQVVKGEIYRIDFNAINRDYFSLQCHSEIHSSLSGFHDISVNCGAQKKLGLVGGKQNFNLGVKSPSEFGDEQFKNPDDPVYVQLAEESFKKYIRTHKDIKVTATEFKVTKVTEQVVTEVITRIDFYVIPTDYQSFPCHSKVYKTKSRKNIEVSCVIPPKNKPKPGGQVSLNPDEYKYAKLAKESYDKFHKTSSSFNAKELKVTKVTRQVVNGDTYRIVFFAIDRDYFSLPCQSKIHVSSTGLHNISVNCWEQQKLVYGDPDDPQYELLAEKSFGIYKKHHKEATVKVKELKVTGVIEQVQGTSMTRIDYYVIPTDYRSFPCHSLVEKQLEFKIIDVSCVVPPPPPTEILFGGSAPENPDDNKYAKLVKESFDKYQETNYPINVKEFKVTKVTHQLVQGDIYRMVFYVIGDDNYSLPCYSKVYEPWIPSDGKKEITVNCEPEVIVGSKTSR